MSEYSTRPALSHTPVDALRCKAVTHPLIAADIQADLICRLPPYYDNSALAEETACGIDQHPSGQGPLQP